MGFFERVSRREKIALVVGALILTAALLDRLVVNPISTRIYQLNREIRMTEKQLGRYLYNLYDADAITEKYQKYAQYVEKVGSDEEETARILRAIESFTRKSALYLVNTKPQAPRTIGFYKEYVVEIETESAMTSLVNFLYSLNKSSQLLRAEKIRLSLKEKTSPLIRATILITKVVIP